MTALTPKRRKVAVECSQPVSRNDFTERCDAEHVFAEVDRNGPKSVLRNTAYQRMIRECTEMNDEEIANNPERHKIYRRKKHYAVDIFRGRVRLIDPSTSIHIHAHPTHLFSQPPALLVRKRSVRCDTQRTHGMRTWWTGCDSEDDEQ